VAITASKERRKKKKSVRPNELTENDMMRKRSQLEAIRNAEINVFFLNFLLEVKISLKINFLIGRIRKSKI